MNPVQAILKRRAPYKSPQGRRIRTLFHAFMRKLNPDDHLHVATALRAAELSTAAEEARGKLLQAGTKELEESVTRLDNNARRAVDDLASLQNITAAPKAPWRTGYDVEES
jgi:hypothetical protein